MGFESLSYISYQVPLNHQRNNIQMEFTTVSQNALLLYYPNEDNSVEFLALEIIDGRVRMSFSLDNNNLQIVRLTAPIRVSDGRWYYVDADRNGRVGNLKVTECEEGQASCNACAIGDRCHVTASGVGST